MSKWALSRRTMLRGLGVSMALPLLDAMVPGGDGLLSSVASGATAAARKAPVRTGFFFLPNGMNMAEFLPQSPGALQLSNTLQPLKAVASEISVLSGLTLDGARAKGDGGGDHARSAAAFLTGAHPVKTNGKDIKLGISVDQVAAQKVGSATRLPSLELGLDRTQTAGNCDSGYSCAYVTNIAWRSDTTPVPKETDPGSLFERLFKASDAAADAEGQAKRLAYRKSILDMVADDAATMDRQLGKSDQRKLDEFQTSIREIEKRIEATRSRGTEKFPEMEKPEGTPKDHGEHFRLMADLIVLAWRMDLTRITTMMVARDGSDRVFRELGLSEGHHTLSHHGNKAEKLEAIKKIDLHHMEQYAYFLQKLKSTPEGSGTLLDNSMIMFGCGISDGNRHNHDNLPVILAGRAGGALKPGRHIAYPKNTPLCNLYVSMLDVMGVKVDRFGDSTGPLRDAVGA